MSKSRSILLICILPSLAFLAGCAPIISGVMNATTGEKDIVEKTAQHFGVAQSEVIITKIEKGALATTYVAKYAAKTYNCSIYYGDVSCKLDVPVMPAVGSVSLPLPVTTASPESGDALKTVPMSSIQAQERLNELGYSVGQPDGVFGKRSIDKLKVFQKSHGLIVSGKLDDATVAALR